MSPAFKKLGDLKRWRTFLARAFENRKRKRLAKALDAAWAAVGPIESPDGGRVILADGMWSNPNHFLRLRLFCEAAMRKEKLRLVGVLRRREDIAGRRALERIGFREFVFLEDDEEFKADDFRGLARQLLAGARTHQDLLALEMPEGVPAYVLFDTVLKLATHPRPPIDDPIWESTLCELFRNVRIYTRTLQAFDVAHVALSHPWKNEWATLVWLALKRKIPSYHLTGFVDAMRIRRFRTTDDYATPVESISRESFERLDERVQRELAEIGRADLALRASGRSSDVNIRHAFRVDQRISGRAEARRRLSGQTAKPVVVVYSHVWADFPHTFAMKNFTDFIDWMETTIARCREIDEIVWLLKPHPTEEWYNKFRLSDLAKDLPSHIRLLPDNTDSQTAMLAADCIVTVHGTVALEAAAAGVCVLLADRSYFSDWGIATVARDRSDYLRLLGDIGSVPRPDDAARRRARACFALALASPIPAARALPMVCDSQVSDAYGEVISRLATNGDDLANECDRVARWLGQNDVDAFAAYYMLSAATANASAVGHAANG
jgi:hypothetical protein